MKHYRSEKICLNCENEVEKNFCSNCGQENLELREPFWHFIGHSISHYFHFDSKFFHTLRPLLTQPGRLTQEYLAGRRTSFLHPVSMYIFVSIVYFLVVPPLSQSSEEEDKPSKKSTFVRPAAATQPQNEIREDLSLIEDQTILKDGIRAVAVKMHSEQFSRLTFSQQQLLLDSLRSVEGSETDSIRELITEFEKVHTARKDSTYESYLQRQTSLPAGMQDNWLEKRLKKQEIAIEQKTNENWDIKKEIQKYNPKLYFLLMPVFAFFLMLNFRKNKKYYIEHLIFTIHFFTAFFIFQILITPLDHFLFNNDSSIISILEFIIILWFIYTGLKEFYQRKKWTTIRKILTLSIYLMVAYSICYGIIYSVVFLTA